MHGNQRQFNAPWRSRTGWAEVRGVAGSGLHQGQDRDSAGSGIRRAQTELRGAALLGTGYFVSTVGRDEAVSRAYIQHQEREDKRLEQMNLLR